MCGVNDVFDLFCGAYVVSKSDGRWAVNWCGFKSVRHGVGCGQKEVGKHVRLLLVTEKGEGVRSD